MTKAKKISLKKLEPYLYILPAMIVSGLFLYYSIGFVIYISFHDWDGLSFNMPFVGLENYKYLFTDFRMYKALFNNLLYMFFVVGSQVVLGLFIAVLLKAKLVGHTLFKSLFFFPTILAPILIGGVFNIMMDPNMGAINRFLKYVGLGSFAIPWLADPRYALMSIILVSIFNWMGFAMVLYIAGLLAIPDDIYEAAKIDGSGFWNTLFKITIPMVRGTTATMIVIGIVGSLKVFDIVVILTNGGPGYSTEVMSTYLFKRFFNDFNGGLASATGVLILVLALVMSIIQLKIYEKSKLTM